MGQGGQGPGQARIVPFQRPGSAQAKPSNPMAYSAARPMPARPRQAQTHDPNVRGSDSIYTKRLID